MNNFAKSGYRTLVFAMRQLSYLESEINYITPADLEKDFTLLGATAMEDLLQDKV